MISTINYITIISLIFAYLLGFPFALAKITEYENISGHWWNLACKELFKNVTFLKFYFVTTVLLPSILFGVVRSGLGREGAIELATLCSLYVLLAILSMKLWLLHFSSSRVRAFTAMYLLFMGITIGLNSVGLMYDVLIYLTWPLATVAWSFRLLGFYAVSKGSTKETA